MRSWIFLALAVVVGCSSDADKDGVPARSDCNDDDAGAYPGADERCNGVDDDCDGVIDEAPTDGLLFYADADGDGFGDGRTAGVLACEPVDGTVANDLDCDDDLAEVNPDAEEACNGVDDNCDGTTDDEGARTWFVDADGDGYGNDEVSVVDCAQPPGYVELGGDCNDGSALYNPGATDDADCVDPRDLNCSGVIEYPDLDKDGANACDDCDDGNPKRFPGNTETCDGVDQDCDGAIDDDPADGSLYHADADADLFGSVTESLRACFQPSGFVVDGTDCDDSTGTVKPGAPELCNGVDDDCDGTIDDGTADAITFFADTDGDGFGDLASTITACAVPEGYSEDSTDCDDTSGDVYPGATEVCEDGLDNDCDTTGEPTCEIDGGEDLAGYSALWVGETDDQATFSVQYAGDVDADGYDDFIVGAPMTGILGPGSAYLVYGASDPTGDFVLADDSVWFEGDNSDDVLGVSVTGGDFDGDGYADVAVGAPQLGSVEGGGVYIIYGGATRPTGGAVGDAADAVLVSSSSFDYAGFGSDHGDTDGDGIDDIVVGAPYSSVGGSFSGAAYLVLGDSGRWGVNDDLADGAATFTSATTLSLLGDVYAMSIVEVDGDGNGEVLLGSTDGGTTSYVSMFVGGAISGSYDVVDDADALLNVPTTAQGRVYVKGVGDLDDDGVDDLVMGWDFYGSRDESLVTLFYGDTTSFSGTIDADTVADATFLSSRDDGTANISGGDVNGDGVSDLTIGGGVKNSGAGAVYVFYGGSLSGSYNYTDADDTVAGATSNDFLGYTLASDGDHDGDGFADLVAGAYGYGDTGAAFVFLGTSL